MIDSEPYYFYYMFRELDTTQRIRYIIGILTRHHSPAVLRFTWTLVKWTARDWARPILADWRDLLTWPVRAIFRRGRTEE